MPPRSFCNMRTGRPRDLSGWPERACPFAKDSLGNRVTASNDAVVAGINDFVGGFLSYETRAARILAAADADRENCLANAYAGMLWMLLEAPQAAERASIYLARAQAAAPSATRREQMNVEFLHAWSAGNIERSLQIADAIADEFRRDLAIVKLHQYLNFNRGRASEMLRIAHKVEGANQTVPYLHGMMAFAYEQCHLLDDAEREARFALELKEKEPWAQHALAHVMLSQGGRVDEGAHFLEAVSETWTDLNSFMITHLWWHLALFYLSQGRDQEALMLYDTRCWGVDKSYSQDQITAVSLLARLELAGIPVGERWQDLGAHLTARAYDTVEPFLTMQYLYGLARARLPEAETLLDAVRARARVEPDRAAWAEVALPACEGLMAFARGDFVQTLRMLGPALARMAEIGGSHAQRDLFEQIALDATIRTGHFFAAQYRLEMRRAFDPDGVPLNRTLRMFTWRSVSRARPRTRRRGRNERCNPTAPLEKADFHCRARGHAAGRRHCPWYGRIPRQARIGHAARTARPRPDHRTGLRDRRNHLLKRV